MDLPARRHPRDPARRRLLHHRDRPANARWLTPEQRTWLTSTLAAEESERTTTAPRTHRAVFRNRKVMALTAIYFLLLCGAYPLTYWMPSVIKGVGKGLTSVQIGWLSAVPFLLAAICMYLCGRMVRDERSSTPALAFTAITIATMAAQTAKPLFWSLPTAFLAGAGAASGLALINSLGNAAGFISPFAVGWIQDASNGNAGLSMTVMILANVLAMIVISALSLSTSRHQRSMLVP